jgi:hypothetical protein
MMHGQPCIKKLLLVLCLIFRTKFYGAQLVEALRYKPEDRGFNSRWSHWKFSLTQSFRPHYGPVVDSASNRNEYQEYFLGGKGRRCVGLTTLPLSCSDCLNFLEPSGPVQACNGIALPF